MANKNTAQPKSMQTGDTTFYCFDPLTGFWGKPNIEREVYFEQQPNVPLFVRHNEEGNRDIHFDFADGKKSIVCLGGSHSWGGGVAQNEKYTDHLRHITGEKVANLGHCSLGLDQICVAVMNKVRRYNPKTVVIEQYPWALHRVLNTYVNKYVKPQFILDRNLELRMKPVPYLARYETFRNIIGEFHAYRKEANEFVGGLNVKEGYDPLNDPIFLYWKLNHYRPMYSLVERLIIQIRDYCAKHDIRLLFALGAVSQKLGPASQSELVDYDLPAKMLRAILNNLRVESVDMSESMLLNHSKEDPVIFNDGHINAKGHRLFAETLAKALEERSWLAS
jgi:hypothetical protein